MAAGAGGNELFSLVGRIRLDGLDKALATIGDIGKKADAAAAKMGEFGQKISDTGAKMQQTGGAMSAGITAPLVAIGAAAVGVANETDKATGRIQAQLGLTEESAKKLTDSAQNLWVNGFGASIEEAANNIALVGQNMQGLNPQQIEEATRQATIFRDAFGEDIAASTAAAQVMMKNFGINSTEAFDLMTVAMQKGGNYSGELLDTMREYAPQFQTMGMSADEMMNVLISGANAGAFNLDKVGDAVKEFNIRAQDGSKTTAAGFSAIGMDADKMGAAIAGGGEKAQSAYQATIAALAAMKDPVERNTAGVALFGTQWEDLSADVVLAMSSTTDQLGKVEGATDRAGAALSDNFGARFTTAMRKLGVALEPIGNILMDLAERALPIVEQRIESLVNWFGSLTAGQQKWIVILGLAAAAAGPLLLVMGSLMGAMGNIITAGAGMARGISKLTGLFKTNAAAAGTATTSQKLFAAAQRAGNGAMKLLAGGARILGTALRFLAMNPIGIAITAITGLIAIGVMLYKNWDTIGPKVTAAIGKIGAFFAITWQNTKALTERVFRAIGAFFVTIFVAYVNQVRKNLNLIKTIFTTVWDFIIRKTREIFGGVRDFITTTLSNLRNRVGELANSAKDKLISAWTTAKRRTTELFGEIKGAIVGKIGEIITEAGKIPGKIGGAITDKIGDATGAMKDLADDLISKFKKALGINSPSRVFFEMAGNIISGLTNGLSAGNLANLGKSVFSQFAGGALNSLDAIKGFLSGGLGGNFGKGADKAAGWIRQAMSIAGVGESWFGPLMQVAKKESGFNPGAQNNWDINAKRGIPSKGLFQTIGPTFGAFKMPGLNDIFNPVHNAVAAIRYMQERYGSVFNLPGVRGLQDGTGYKGYYKGGVFTGPSVVRMAENAKTPVEAAIPLSGRYMWPFADAIGSRIAQNGGPGGGEQEPVRLIIEVPVILNGREIARAAAPEIDVELARRQQRDARARGRRP